jgi:hypothetical protein
MVKVAEVKAPTEGAAIKSYSKDVGDVKTEAHLGQDAWDDSLLQHDPGNVLKGHMPARRVTK